MAFSTNIACEMVLIKTSVYPVQVELGHLGCFWQMYLRLKQIEILLFLLPNKDFEEKNLFCVLRLLKKGKTHEKYF